MFDKKKRDSFEFSFWDDQAQSMVFVLLERQSDGSYLMKTNIRDLEISLPYLREEKKLDFLSDNPDGELFLRIENPPFIGMGDLMIVLDGPAMFSHRSAVIFASVGDILPKGDDPHAGKMCLWVQDGVGSWRQKHLIATEQETSLK